MKMVSVLLLVRRWFWIFSGQRLVVWLKSQLKSAHDIKANFVLPKPSGKNIAPWPQNSNFIDQSEFLYSHTLITRISILWQTRKFQLFYTLKSETALYRKLLLGGFHSVNGDILEFTWSSQTHKLKPPFTTLEIPEEYRDELLNRIHFNCYASRFHYWNSKVRTMHVRLFTVPYFLVWLYR